MCLILFANNAHPKYKLIVAANRDEFYERPTKPADYWEENPNILAGRDLEAGGTWLGITKQGRLSLLTNFRDLQNIKSDAPSRGHLVSDFLKSNISGQEYLNNISEEGELYNGFNIICGDWDNLHYYGNYQKGVHKIDAGVHGLSNALLDTHWPKVVKGIDNLKELMKQDKIDPDQLFELLYDDQKAADSQLPNTGVGYEMEKMLSPLFIKSERYGSRCSTVLLVDKNDNVTFIERTYNTSDFTFTKAAYQL
ncbi:NRDE family protein [Fulvivirga lutimaris]|uniref:NRDE family protein n=1 Tax=Fulvivirga lutimaris TaxID=1819566 RepID=UPI0012BC0108|nr:NRDE family protein [Fulvivirga lutimaris]MTI40535.1 NRDE family protein [Fulvivirga lutimaris]